MTIIHTENLSPGSLSSDDTLQTYCGLDCCVTLEVLEELQRLHNQPPEIYQFEKALQAPMLEIMQRGFLVDSEGRQREAESLRRRISQLQLTLSEFAQAVWDRPLNPRSPKQLAEFFYQALQLPEVWLSQKGERKLSTSREALEKLYEYLHARPFVNCILAIRALAKQLDFFEIGIDSDGRFRTSYNIAGTESGRLSSSENAFGTGGNAQNVASYLRYVFIADRGFKIGSIDLEQVEARDVGYFCGCLFDDWTYLDNCESGDLHTNNAKMVWPEKVTDRQSADQIFYRDMTYRDMAKRGGHLTNYYGTAWTMSRHLKIPVAVAEGFQQRYCRGEKAVFPAIPKWWQWVAQQLQTTRLLTTPFGRQRHFFGRPGDDTTLREAIAFLPQSTTADRTNLGLWRIWRYMPQVQLLAQTHDSVTFQFPDTGADEKFVEEALELMRVTLTSPHGRRYVVPGEAKVGWNWGPYSTEEDVAKGRARRVNPEGLQKYKRGVPDQRVRQHLPAILDRRFV